MIVRVGLPILLGLGLLVWSMISRHEITRIPDEVREEDTTRRSVGV
jgi:hypothetical protein